MTTTTELKTQILDLCRKLGEGVSFVELERIPGFAGGSCSIGDSQKNLVFWHRLTEEACDALAELLTEKRIYIQQTLPLVYLVDGDWPQGLPFAVRVPQKGYKEPHWLPAVLNLVQGVK